jgi:hypothetical protein
VLDKPLELDELDAFDVTEDTVGCEEDASDALSPLDVK